MSQDPTKHDKKNAREVSMITGSMLQTPKKEKYDFNKMKEGATSDDPVVRMAAFTEYFERFNEFPSFLFDNETKIDPRLAATMRDLSNSENSSRELLDGITALLNRLPS